MINYVYPEKLPSKKARSVSAVNTACELSKMVNTTFYYEKSGKEILEFYGLTCKNLNLVPVSKKFIFRSNKIFHFNLKNKINDDIFYVRHLKVAKELIKQNKKVIFEIHEIFSDINPKVHMLEKFVYEHASGIVCVNQVVKKECLRKFNVKAPIKVIYNGCGFNVDFIQKDFTHVNEMFYIGSSQKWKGVEFLLNTMKHLDISLKIVGDAASMEAEQSNVDLLGFKSKEEVLTILENSKLTVIPNLPYKESFFSVPIKLFEYMRTSNIVVSSDFEPIREIIDDKENGFLFKAGDEDSFIDTVNYIRSLPPKKLQEIAHNAYETSKEFTWEKRAEKIVAFTKEVMVK